MAGGEVMAGTVGRGRRSVPSRPVSPWMSVGACIGGRRRAWEAPTWTGMVWALWRAVRMEVAFWVVFLYLSISMVMVMRREEEIRVTYSSEALPKTVETPRMRMAGW